MGIESDLEKLHGRALARAAMRELYGSEIEPPAELDRSKRFNPHDPFGDWCFRTLHVMRRRYKFAASRGFVREQTCGHMSAAPFKPICTHLYFRGEWNVRINDAADHLEAYLHEALYLARKLARACCLRGLTGIGRLGFAEIGVVGAMFSKRPQRRQRPQHV
jgi:hypothetical protein